MPVIAVDGLRKTFHPGIGKKPVEALKGITMSVEEREIFGVLGPNGAGKTTTMKILLGFIFATGGGGTIFGKPIGDPDAKRRLGFLPEQPYFYDQLTGREILDYYGRLFGIDAAERAKRAARLLERVGLAHAADQPLRGYSKGMLQRIGIAQALVNDPELVILDEPMSGLDPVGRKEVRDLILELRGEKRTVFFSTHILSDVEAVCDRVAILDKGRVVALSPLADLLAKTGGENEIVVSGARAEIVDQVGRFPGCRATPSGNRVIVRAPDAQLGTVVGIATELGGTVVSVEKSRASLEQIFMSLIEKPEAAT